MVANTFPFCPIMFIIGASFIQTTLTLRCIPFAPQTLRASLFIHSFFFTNLVRNELEKTQKPSVWELDTGVLLQFLFRMRSTHWHFMLTVGPVPPSYCHAHVTPVNAGDQRQAVITCHIMPRENMLVFLTAAPRRCANTTQCCHATTRWPATEECCRCCSAAVRLKRP